MTVSPLMRRRLHNFRANRRGYWSLWIFLAIFGLTLCAEVIVNDKPLLVRYEGQFYFPVVKSYAETTFGGVFPTEAVYRDPALIALVNAKGWMLCRRCRSATAPSTTHFPSPPRRRPRA